MQRSDAAGFKSLLEAVYALYRVDLSEAVLGIWWQAMSGFDLAAVKDALTRHAMNPDSGQFLPKPADVVKLIAGSTLDSALLAWAKVDRAVRSVGTYASVVFDDPIIHVVVTDMGGWLALGQVTEDDWPFRAKEFAERYRGYRLRSALPPYPRSLAGRVETDNGSRGLSYPPPKVIGDPDRALLVYRRGAEDAALAVTSLALPKRVEARP